MKFILLFLLLSIVSGTTSVFKSHSSNRAAPKSTASGPCDSNGGCVEPGYVCDQLSRSCVLEAGRELDGSKSCEDKNASHCQSRARLCKNKRYYQQMTEQCPKTCNRCSSK
ncbi:ShKT domain-containing protein [Aphelenchoides besseyi]|nr:ShKT domain-containing protein [Aphelenchoides besseyi]